MKTSHVVVVALVLVAAGCGRGDGTQGPSDGTSRVGQALGNVVQVVERSDIVSNQSGAEALNPKLRNAWGLAFNPRGVAWVSAAESGLSGVYRDDGSMAIPSVTIPTPSGGTPPSHPTGQVFNSDTSAFKGDVFVFVTEDGTISGWQNGTSAVLRADNSPADANYKGVTIATSSGEPRLYAANFHEGTVEVYDRDYKRVDTKGRFRDERIPDGFAPFNVQEIRGNVYVTYAKQDADGEDDVKGAGNGFVDVFDPDGALVSRLIAGGVLNSPWGLAIAPEGFGDVGGRLLVGNFGDGKINVYELTTSSSGPTAKQAGVLGDDKGKAIVIDGLWALRFGVDAGGFSSTDLYFTAGPNDEEDGVFGELEAAEPSPSKDGGGKDAGAGDAGRRKAW